MGIQDRTEFVSEHLFERIERQAKLNYKTPKNHPHMLNINLQNSKYFVKLSAIFVGALAMILTGQPDKAEAKANFNSFVAESSQNMLNWQGSSLEQSKLLALRHNPLSIFNINQNIQKNLLFKLPTTEISFNF